MENSAIDYSALKELLIQDRDSWISTLKRQLSQESEFYNRLLIIEKQHENLKKSGNLGLLSQDDLNRRTIQIDFLGLTLIDDLKSNNEQITSYKNIDLEKLILSKDEAYKELQTKFLKSANNTFIQMLLLLFLIIEEISERGIGELRMLLALIESKQITDQINVEKIVFHFQKYDSKMPSLLDTMNKCFNTLDSKKTKDSIEIFNSEIASLKIKIIGDFQEFLKDRKLKISELKKENLETQFYLEDSPNKSNYVKYINSHLKIANLRASSWHDLDNQIGYLLNAL